MTTKTIGTITINTMKTHLTTLLIILLLLSLTGCNEDKVEPVKPDPEEEVFIPRCPVVNKVKDKQPEL